MSSSPIQTLPPAPRPVRKPFLAAALSMLLPGVGLLYVGAILPALAFLGLWVVLRPGLALLLAAGSLEVGTYLSADSVTAWVLRIVAAVVSYLLAVRTAAKPISRHSTFRVQARLRATLRWPQMRRSASTP